jgi:hypothetical protein
MNRCTPDDLDGASPNGTLIIINQTDATGKVVGTPSPSAALSGIAFDSNGWLLPEQTIHDSLFTAFQSLP